MMLLSRGRWAVVAATIAVSACRAPAAPPVADEVIGWRRVAAWSGRGNMQSQSFTSDTGEFRLHWEATNETAPGKGWLRVQFRSGDSGRVIVEPVDHQGTGKDTVQVADTVRWYYLTVASADVDWSLLIEEPILGRTVRKVDR